MKHWNVCKGIGVALIVAVGGMAACSGKAEKPDKKMTADQMGPNLAGPRTGVFLRASFDDDPSHFIGRFIGSDVGPDEIDENRGIQTECSQYVTYKEVNASGSFDEYYNSSTSVRGGLGISNPASGVASAAGVNAPEGSANLDHQSGTSIRVKYDLQKKLVANVEDPVAFKECCQSSPDNCTGKYIGEFWYGTGTLFENTGKQTGGGVDVSAPQGEGNVQVADGWVWRRATEFSDVYFAFRVMDRVATDDCSWAERPPKSDDGQYFVGVSPPAATEDLARQAAMRHARTQAVRYMGEFISSTTSNTSNTIQGYVESENVVNTAAEGMANFVKDDRYCSPEKIETPEGVKYKMKVLAFFPEESKKEAATATVDAIEKQAEADGKLTPDLKKQLEQVRANLGN
jgi:hypothetical protein